jgi:type IV fimbrial biogenesis protein FimT
MRKHAHGFTLLDLLLSLTLLSALATLGGPVCRTMLHEHQMRQASTRLLASATLARSEATKRNQAIMVKARNGNWSEGWDVFVDLNNNAQLDAGEPVISQQPGNPQISIRGNAPVARYLRLTPTGRAKLPGGAFQAGTLRLCHRHGMIDQRRLILSATGRIRSERATTVSDC